MTEYQLEQMVNKIAVGQNGQETKLFKEAILAQLKPPLTRIPTEAQIANAWQRWKRERGLESQAEPDVNTTSLYIPRSLRK